MPPRHWRKEDRVEKRRAIVDPPQVAVVCGHCKEILRPVDAARDVGSATGFACHERAACMARLREQAFYERTRSER